MELQNHVIFHDRYISDSELHEFLCAADIYVTPYLYKEQLTSGTLAFAVGAGKAVVSTPYWAAEELLAEDRGRLVEFGDSEQMALAITQILNDDSLLHMMQFRAYQYGRAMTWSNVGRTYWDLFEKESLSASTKIEAAAPSKDNNITQLRLIKSIKTDAGHSMSLTG